MTAARAELIHRTAATAAVDRVRFRHPVQTGDVLRFRASVNAAWRTSMEVGIRLAAPADLHQLHALPRVGRPSPLA